ncbi:MAG: PKD domain-containing protein [Candidatus Calescibacterium sp.]|nr:PKD domain-containing protein [Candidatus Calescibacterium sp.]
MKKGKVLGGKIWNILALLSISFLFSDCSGGCSGCKKNQTVQEQQIPQELTVGGVVIDDTGNPVENALVTARIDANQDGLLSPDESFATMTDKNGHFILTARIVTARVVTGRILTARVQVSVEKEGFVRNSVVIEPNNATYISNFKIAKAYSAVDKNTKDGVQFSLVKGPAGAPRLISGLSKGEKLKLKSEGSEILVDINIPPELIPPSESISASVSWVDPISDPDLMPGNFLAYSERPIMLSSAGFISVQMRNEEGEEIKTLAPRKVRTKTENQSATIKMKIPDSAIHTLYDYVEETTDKVEAPMWYFDDRTGVWLPGEELGIIVDESDNALTPRQLAQIVSGRAKIPLYIKANVNHFSEWNVDYPITTHSSICGQIVDSQGKGISGLHITTQGNTYGGLGDWKGTYTDANGKFCVDVKKSDPENPRGGGSDCFEGLKNSITTEQICKDLLAYAGALPFVADIASIEIALDKIKQQKLIDDAMYNNIKKMLDGAQNDLSKGEFGKANDKIRDAMKALEPIGRASADQIFYERWDQIGEEAKKFILDTLVGCGLDIMKKGTEFLISKLNGISGCEQFGGQFLLDFGKSLYDLGSSIAKGEADASTLIEFAAGNIMNVLGNDKFLECIGKASPGVGLDICFLSIKGKNVGLNSSAGSVLFAAEALATLAGQAIQAWGEHGEWKSAKAYETVQPHFDNFLKNYNEFLRELKKNSPEFYEKCNHLLKRECAYFKPKEEPRAPRTKTKQGEENPIKVFADLVSSVIALTNLMDKILLGGNEIILRWSVRCQEIDQGYICENSNKVMKCENKTFSENLTGFYCTETDQLANKKFDTRKSSVFAYTDIPLEKRGGETRSKILIDGTPANIISDIGINWGNVGSPTLNSTAHKDELWFYVEESVRKNPSRYIGRVKLDLKSYKIKGRVLNKRNQPITQAYILSECGKNVYTTTDNNGNFELYLTTKIQSCKIYINGKKLDVQLGDSTDIDLGNIVLNLAPRITTFSSPSEANKNELIRLDVNAEDQDSASLNYRWFADGNPIGEGKSITYRIKKNSYICAQVSDEENQVSRCGYVYIRSIAPKLVLEYVPDEFEEGKTYSLRLSATDPDSDWEELRFSTFVDYDQSIEYNTVNIFSNTPSISFDVKQDKNIDIYFNVCDENWKCDYKTKTIRIKNIPKTPYVKIYASKRIALVGEVITFQVETTNAESITWDFGDGSQKVTNSLTFVQRAFSSPRVFKITAEARSEDNITAQDSITVDIGEPPKIISFSASSTEGIKPLQVDFNLNAQNFESLRWDLGDGTAFISQIPRAQHTYTRSGIIVAQATAINRYGSSSTYTNIYVRNTSPTITSFVASTTFGSVPLSVNFSASVTDNYKIKRYVFTFGDGFQRVIDSETLSVSATHTYTTAGTFSASVTVYDDEEASDTRNLTIIVTAQPQCDIPTVSLTANPSSGPAPLTVTLTANAYSSFTISQYQWDFDNNGIIDAVSTSPSTNYTFYSTKTVRVKAVNSCGNYGVATTTISITRQFHSADFFTPISSCAIPLVYNDNDFAIGDFNNDGKQDIVVGLGASGYLAILTGSGAGTFSVSSTFFSSYLTQCIPIFAVDNFTGDSKPDIVVTCLHFSNVPLILYENTSSSSINFLLKSTSPLPPDCYSFKIMSSDFNSDGVKDVFVGCSGPSYYSYGNGTSFPNFVSLGAVSSGWTPDAVIEDIDSDGKPDIVGVNSDYNYLYIARNTGNGFDTSATIPVTYPHRIESGDFNSDGKIDIVVYRSDLTYVSQSTNFFLDLYINNSSGNSITFYLFTTTNATIGSPLNGIEFKIAELNNDATPDYLYTGYRSYPLKITHFNLRISYSDNQFPASGSSYFSSVTNSGFIGSNSSPRIEVADFTSDGFTDVLMIHENGCVVVFKRKTYSPAPSFVEKETEESKISEKEQKQNYGCSSAAALVSLIPVALLFVYLRKKKRKFRFKM